VPDSRAFRLLSLEGQEVAIPKAEELEDTVCWASVTRGCRLGLNWGLTGGAKVLGALGRHVYLRCSVLPNLCCKREKIKMYFLFFRVGPDRFKIGTCKVTPAAGNERGGIEIKDYVILPRREDNRSPPRINH
jgi:hypothetical protein